MDSTFKPFHLRCEYEINPLGIGDLEPRLSWQLNDPRRGAKQTAYKIIADSSPESLNGPSADLWNTGKISSDASIHIPYKGSPLHTGQRVYWKVRTWDASDEASAWSEPAWFEIGLLNRTDWKGRWIGSPILGGPYSIPPAPYLRKQFSIDKPIAEARLYATALGLYEFEINGIRVGEDVFTPGRTEYHKRVPYHTYDVTQLLNTGPNVAGAILGDGWYCGHLHTDPRQTYGDRPRLLAQIEIRFQDGSSTTYATDGSWKASDGPIRSSDMLMGEDYDARLEIPGWNAPGFGDSKWGPVILFDDPKIEVVAHRAPPIRRKAEIRPIAEPTLSQNKRRALFDLGQNIVGRVKLKVRGPAGQVIDLRFAEILDKSGVPYTASLRSARATDHYTTRGGEHIFESRFTFHGFRYVEVRDYPGTITKDDLVGVVLHSDAPPTGTFECSDPMINQLQSNITWSQRGNFLDIPTDCPQRDERLGWTGDAQVFIRTAAFNMEIANFFDKWLTDMADSQGEDGRVPAVVPDVKSIYGEGGPAWADAAVICPWTVWRCYGDERILHKCYPMMRKFMGFLEKYSINLIRADDNWAWKGYGDWLSMNAETPNDLIGTAYFARCAQLMSEIAGVVGNKQDARHYADLSEKIRAAWVKRYVTPDGLIVGQTQTAYVLALHFDLIPHSLRPKIAEKLVADIQARQMHLSTGFVGTPCLNHVLSNSGHIDVAFALLNQKTFPSWLYPITQDATTIWERWDAWTHEKGFNNTDMNSFNHYAYGAVGEWMYAVIGGIDLDKKIPGYKHIIIHPRPGGGLTHAKASLESMYGKIECNWKLDGGKILLDVTIPPNTTASIRIDTAQADSITEAGQPVNKSSGITIGEKTEESISLEVGAGRFSFAVQAPRVTASATQAGPKGVAFP